MATPVIDRPTAVAHGRPTGVAPDRPEATPQDRWATAPVEVGPRRRQRWWLRVLLGLGIAVVAYLASIGSLATPFATSPRRAPEPAPQRLQAPVTIPFVVTVEVTQIASMDNDRLFGRDPTAEPSVDAVVQQVGVVLQQYLDAQFVEAPTRFTEAPIAGLLTERARDAVSDDDLTGLGVLDGAAVDAVEARPVEVQAQVLTSGSDVELVTVLYHARARVAQSDGTRVPLHQRATMVFVPEDDTWRAEAVDAVLDLPLTGR